MTEDEARAALNVPRETLERLDAFAALVKVENEKQNLVSKSSLESIWNRHILDSAQLISFVSDEAETWLDIGSGAGFPGLITALLFEGATTLVEPRKLRVEFLHRAADTLGIVDRVTIFGGKVEAMPPGGYDVISARAFAALPALFGVSQRFAATGTRWVLPKGKNAKTELEEAESLWQGTFRLEPSRTDPDAWIVIAEQVRRRPEGRRGR